MTNAGAYEPHKSPHTITNFSTMRLVPNSVKGPKSVGKFAAILKMLFMTCDIEINFVFSDFAVGKRYLSEDFFENYFVLVTEQVLSSRY